jgi:signal transduction histidine kinase
VSGERRARRRLLPRISEVGVGGLLGATIGVLLVLAVVGIGLALLANKQLTHSREQLLDQIGPARRTSLALENALVNEETGARGYLITGERSFLAPYETGLRDQAHAYAELRAREAAIGPATAAEVELTRTRASEWQQEFVVTALTRTREGRTRSIAEELHGKALFDRVRASLVGLQTTLGRKDARTRSDLDSAADTLQWLLVLAAVLILGGVLFAGYLLRRTITRPLERLGDEARRVAGGEFARPLAVPYGPREIAEVGAEIDAMRQRIVEELADVRDAHVQLERQALELRRSNAELEQFAYVASHDLQEPLRKITSFCQALQTRYGGQLDERADQYIEFAVDGAKRMQSLINDLLAFSRVGRGGRADEPVALDAALEAARKALTASLEHSHATVSADALPTVHGDAAQLTSLFQNLISNAVKFHGLEPPVVRISVAREGDGWELAVADNGIGIDSGYAERIFLIFQRLHTRESYEGSGIGLALCRKIVEDHGGRIWLDTDYSGGACFRFTLPDNKEAAQ